MTIRSGYLQDVGTIYFPAYRCHAAGETHKLIADVVRLNFRSCFVYVGRIQDVTVPHPFIEIYRHKWYGPCAAPDGCVDNLVVVGVRETDREKALKIIENIQVIQNWQE